MSQRRTSQPSHVTEDMLEMLSRIMGPASASAAALADIVRRRSAGEDPFCYDVGGRFIVGPKITSAHAEEKGEDASPSYGVSPG